MPAPKLIRCGKCHVVMGLRHFVLVHRKPNDVPCDPVPCAVCKGPVGHEGLNACGDAVCSSICKRNHPGTQALVQADREISDQLAAMERARQLPMIYQRRRRAS